MSNEPSSRPQSPGLSQETRDQIAALVRSGRFANADELVREGLDLIERQATTCDDDRLVMLRAAVQRGMDAFEQGRFRVFEDRASLDAYFTELTNGVIERKNAG